MKKTFFVAVLLCVPIVSILSQPVSTNDSAAAEAKSPSSEVKTDDDTETKVAEWVASLNLDDSAKAARVQKVIATHLKNIRDWNNEHSYTNIPAGINPYTGKPLSNMDRQLIIISAQPKSYHADLMTGLRKDLTEEQVEAILDKYTVGKVAFTMKGYHAIVPDLTPTEEMTILGFLKQAREQAVDYKNMKQISAIFEIYKTKSEQYLNSNGRNWHQLYGDYVRAAKAKKAAAQTNSPAKQP